MASSSKTSLYLVLALALFVLVRRPATSVEATWKVDSQGKVSSQQAPGQVLGDDDDDDRDEDEDDDRGSNSGSGKSDDRNDSDDDDSNDDDDDRGNSGSGNSGSSNDDSDDSDDDKSSSNSGSGNSSSNKTKVKVRQVVDGTEIRYEYESEGDTLEVGESRTKSKLRVRLADDDDASGSGEIEDEVDGIEIEDDELETRTRVRSKDNASYVIRARVAAKTNFPLQVNLETNELIVTTPKGSKVVTVLPDKAVENMLAANVLDQLGGKGGLQWLAEQTSESGNLDNDDDATGSGDLRGDGTPEDTEGEGDDDLRGDGTPEDNDASESGDLRGDGTPEDSDEPEVIDEADVVVEMESLEDGTLAYRIRGTKRERLLGIWDVELERDVLVSAETGELLDIIQDFRTNLLDWLSRG